MRNFTKQYINGEWVESASNETIDVINPATEEVIGKIKQKEIMKMLIKLSKLQMMFIYHLDIVAWMKEKHC